MSKRFTEGIAFDGTAILDNGKPITITEILNNLNKLDKLKSNKECITDENKLLPCPFCGGKAEIKQTGRLKLKLRCTSCLIDCRPLASRRGLTSPFP